MAWFMQMDSRSQIDANLKRVSVESVEALSAKRRREGQSAGFSVEWPFDQLPDDLKEEILCRLPLLSVLRFRCVCKGWRSLTTSPRFLQRLERHHNLLKLDRPVGLLLQGIQPKRDKQLVVCSGVPKSKCLGYSLDFLPGLADHDSIVLSGSCNDLLLCGKEEWNKKYYFVMNFVTRKWAALPPILWVCYFVLTGFVCDPTAIPEAKKGANLRYRVVHIPVSGYSETEFNVDIFSSEDGQWNNYVMRCDAAVREMSCCCETAVACNGSLYWKSRRRGGKILALDPFNPTKKEVVMIESPPDTFYAGLRQNHLGINRGKLRMSQTILSGRGFCGPLRLHIWELEEGEGGAKWRSIKEVSLDAITAANPSYLDIIKSHYRFGYWYWKTLAFHPIEGDIIYFACILLGRIIICNLKTSRLEIVHDINFNDWHCDFSAVFPIVMPWCPTPVPALPEL